MTREQFKELILSNSPQFRHYNLEIDPVVNMQGGQDICSDGMSFSNPFIEGLYQGYLLRMRNS